MPDGKILLADDNRLVVNVTKAMLEDAGYGVEVAWDGVGAIRKAYTCAPDLIVLDIEMPKINGYQVCRLLKDDRMTAPIPIVMMTARDQQPDVFWGIKTGADAYITKGFKPKEFIDLIGEQMERARGRRGKATGTTTETGELNGEGVFTRVIDTLDSKLFKSTILSELGSMASASEDYRETIKNVLGLLHGVLGNPIGIIFLFDEEEMVVLISEPVDGSYLEEAKTRGFEIATRYGWADYQRDRVKMTLYGEELILEGEGESPQVRRSYAHVPLRAQRKAMGILVAGGYQNPNILRRSQEIMDTAQNHVTIVVDNARLYEAARRLAITDGLTKIYNHRFFQELFEKEFKRSDRYKSVFSMIMLDIDLFKNINDTYGHLYGDEILKGLAELISNCLRSMDSVARYGGEEFAILLPETSGPEAIQTAERIRRAVEEHTFPTNEEDLKITISAGVATYPSPGVQERFDIIAKADSALYEAKDSGRNRVCFCE